MRAACLQRLWPRVALSAWVGIFTVPALLGHASAERFSIDRARGSTLVEGSSGYGGEQPDFVIDANDWRLAQYLADVRQHVSAATPLAERVVQATLAVHSALADRRHATPAAQRAYDALLARHRASGSPIPLGAYLELGIGVCREHALLLHLTLDALGVPNDVAYVRAKVDYPGRKAAVSDHSLTVIRGGALDGFVADAFYLEFHGVHFSDLVRASGVTSSDRRAPWALPARSPARTAKLSVLHELAFPRVAAASTRPPRPASFGAPARRSLVFASREQWHRIGASPSPRARSASGGRGTSSTRAR